MPYGRNTGKAQSDYGKTAAAYQYSPRAAQDYLIGDSLKEYEAAKKDAFTPFQAGQGWRASIPAIDKRLAAFGKMERLRDVASMKALGEFTQAAGQLSKPWKLQAPEGFLTEEQHDRIEPPQTAHPKYMGDPDDPYTYAGVRKELTTRQMDPDEGFSLLGNENDRRLRLRSYLEGRRLSLGGEYDPYGSYGDWNAGEKEYWSGQ